MATYQNKIKVNKKKNNIKAKVKRNIKCIHMEIFKKSTLK